MNNRKYNTNPALLLEQGRAIMSSSDESRFYFRVFAVSAVISGFPASGLSKIAGVSRATVTNWVKIADENGFEALKPKSHPGRPQKLSPEQYQEIDAALQVDPKQHGYKNWDGPSLSAFILREYSISLSVRQCQRLFHALGYSLIRPQPYPSKGQEDTEERNEFKKNAPR